MRQKQGATPAAASKKKKPVLAEEESSGGQEEHRSRNAIDERERPGNTIQKRMTQIREAEGVDSQEGNLTGASAIDTEDATHRIRNGPRVARLTPAAAESKKKSQYYKKRVRAVKKNIESANAIDESTSTPTKKDDTDTGSRVALTAVEGTSIGARAIDTEDATTL
jgi:hypothetical protein